MANDKFKSLLLRQEKSLDFIRKSGLFSLCGEFRKATSSGHKAAARGKLLRMRGRAQRAFRV